jgi:hypothetical protein
MKKIVLLFLASFVVCWSVFAQTWDEAVLADGEYIQAVSWMYEQQMTKYLDPIAFRPADLLSRQEAAKFFVGYATKIALKTIDTSRYCAFSDLEDADPTLKNDILQSCLLRLFKGNQGNFMPFEMVTKAQAITVLLRATETEPLDESGTPRWLRAYELAKEKQYTKETDVYALDRPVTRYELALLLWRVSWR